MFDALDECNQRVNLMEVLKTLVAWKLNNLHLIMTSRRERDIESSLVEIINQKDMICLASAVVDKDIQKYVRQRLADDKCLSKWGKDAALRQEIENTLVQGSKGMYVF